MEQKTRLIPPVYLLLTLIAMGLLHRFAPLARVVVPPCSYAGALLLVLGAICTGTAARAFGKAGTPLVPFERATALVTDGLYRFTRNPMYLGLVLIALGVWLLLGTLSALLPLALFLLIIEFRFVRAEERFLESTFGGKYLGYKDRVRRWI